jgi:hypothetical protein
MEMHYLQIERKYFRPAAAQKCDSLSTPPLQLFPAQKFIGWKTRIVFSFFPLRKPILRDARAGR